MRTNRLTIVGVAAMAALAISIAAPVAAAPGVPGDDTVGTDAHSSWNKSSQTPYGSYQNDNTRQSGARR